MPLSTVLTFQLRRLSMGNSNSASENSSSNGDEDDENRTTHDDTKETTTAKQSEDDEEENSEDGSLTSYPSSNDSIDAEDNIWRPPDIDNLFSPEILTQLVRNMPNKAKNNQMATQENALLRYLENRYYRGDGSIGKEQFCEALINWGLSKEESERCFSLFDTEGRQEIDVSSAIRCLRSRLLDFTTLDNGIPLSLQILRQCSLMPGCADIRSTVVDVEDHEKNVETFLNQARLRASTLPWIPDTSLDSLFRLRQFVIEQWIHNEKFLMIMASASGEKSVNAKGDAQTIKSEWPRPQKATPEATENNSGVPGGAKVLKRCYNAISVSSNKKDVQKLTDGDPNTYWQSDGRAGGHYIEILFKRNVVVTKLSIGVSSVDKNFMPNVVTLSVARSSFFGELRPYARPPNEIPASYQGNFTLMSNGQHAYRRIRINIKRCHGNGCDTRVRGIEIEGYRKPEAEDPETLPLEEAGVMWYLNILTSTVEACLPIAPSLKRMVIDHTKLFADRLSPLSLTGCEEFETSISLNSKTTLLTPAVLDAAERSLERMFSDSDDSLTMAAVKILSSFALARLNSNSIIRLVHYLVINQKSEVPAEVADSVKRAMESTMTSLFVVHATRLPCLIVSADGSVPNGFGEWICERPFASSPGKETLDIVLKPPSECSSMILTRMVIKVSPLAPTAPSTGVVYAVSKEAVLEKFTKLEEGGESSPDVGFNSIKEIGRFDLKSKEQFGSDVELFLEPCQCQLVFIRLRDPRNPEKATHVAIERIFSYGFAQAETTTTANKCAPKMYLPMLWKNIDESNRNVELADRLLLFTNMIHTLAYDFDVGSLNFGLSGCVTPLDMDQLCSTFELIFGAAMNQWTLKLAFLQFTAGLFRRGAFLKIQNSDPSKLRQIWSSLAALSTSENKSAQAPAVSSLAVDIIANGVTVFYPSEADRKNGLFSLLSDFGNQPNQVVSEATFIALCDCFSGSEASPLIDLPYGGLWEKMGEGDSIKQASIDVFEKLYAGYISCLTSDLKNSNSAKTSSKRSNSSRLASAINAQQLRIFAWYCHQKKETVAAKGIATQKREEIELYLDGFVFEVLALSLRYLKALFKNLPAEFNERNSASSSSVESPAEAAPMGSAFTSIYQLAMAALGSSKADVTALLIDWATVMEDDRMKHIITSSVSKTAQEIKKELTDSESELATLMRWNNVESSHPYECPSHLQKEFRQPGAVVFEIDFAHNCMIDVNDYLTFISDRGRKVTVKSRSPDKKAWPKRLTIRSRDHLQFIFHSEIRTSSTKHWGYKLTITAKGIPTPALSTWTSDLFLTLAQFGGHLFATGMKNSEGSEGKTDSNENELPAVAPKDSGIKKEKYSISSFLKMGKEFLRYFRTAEDNQKYGSSVICLTFLRPSLDSMASYMNSFRTKDALAVTNMLMEYWTEIVEAEKVLANDGDRHIWLVNILHLFPWRCLCEPEIYGNLSGDQVDQIVKLIFDTVMGQQNSLKRNTVELREELVDVHCYGTFQDWLAMLRPDKSGAISEHEFRLWRRAKLSTDDMDEKRRAKLFVSQYADILSRRIICDGCNQTVDGIRYHCLDCIDVDLCSSCLSFGDGPISHSNDHRLVAFSFKCNRCDGYIIGSRFHCSVCKDFDLCFGCRLRIMDELSEENEENEKKKKTPGHKREHTYVSFPPTCLKEEEAEAKLMDQYLAHLAWLMAVRLALRVSAQKSPAWETAFGSTLVTTAKDHFLTKPLSEPSEANSSDSWVWSNRIAAVEQENCDRLLGLLALASNLGGANWPHRHDALVLIYRLLKSECGESRPFGDHLALFVLGKLCLSAGPEASDAALNECSRTPVQGCEPGYLTLQFLFVFGSSCLTTMRLQWSATVASIWAKMLENADWSTTAGRCLEMKMVIGEKTEAIEAVFAYLIFTGFPGYLARGTEVEYTDVKGQKRRGTVVEVVGERGLFKILDPHQRRLRFVQATDITQCIATSFRGETSNLMNFADLIADSQLAVTSVSTEYPCHPWPNASYDWLMTAALSMKALSNDLKTRLNLSDYVEELFSADFCQDLIQIASRSTTLPVGTRAEMIENYIVGLFDSSSDRNGMDLCFGDLDQGGDMIESDFLRTLPLTVRNCLKECQKEFNVPFSLLRAIYDLKQGDTASLLHEVRRLFFVRGAAPLSQDIIFRAACLERAASVKELCRRYQKNSACPIDCGISPLHLISERLGDTSRLETTFSDEDFFLPHELASSQQDWSPSGFLDRESDNKDGKPTGRAKYAEQILFQSNLQRERLERRELLQRLSAALTILQARKLLSVLISRWPDTLQFDEQHFGLESYWQLLNLADMFRLTPDCVSGVPRVLSVIFDRCSKNLVKPLSYACCQLLQEGIDETLRQKFVGAVEKTIKFPKASCVRVFAQVSDFGDGRLSVEYDDPVRGIQGGPSLTGLVDSILNTNEVRIDFMPERYGGKELNLKITAKSFRYFDTGYKMLRLIFNAMLKDESIREKPSADHLWVWLLYICCRTNGRQRLKVIELLTRLVSVLENQKPEGSTPPIEFRLAVPLWRLLGDLNTICTSRRLSHLPETGRSLGQLFYMLERLVIKWKAEDKFSFAMCDTRPQIRSYVHGCRIVADICAGIGIENEITTLLQAMAIAASKKGKKDGNKTIDGNEDEERKSNDNETSDSDDGRLSDLMLTTEPEDSDDSNTGGSDNF